MDCCDHDAYRGTFNDQFARRVARRYRERGLDKTRQQIVDFLAGHGLSNASILDIGGGVGELHVELLRRGAARATALELSQEYDAAAAVLLTEHGLEGRVTRRHVDIAVEPDSVEPADIVVLHRVVCCYPDYERLLTAAADHARRVLVFSHPPRTAFTRSTTGMENLFHRIRRTSFRAYVHPPGAMARTVESRGLALGYERAGWAWTVVGFSR